MNKKIFIVQTVLIVLLLLVLLVIIANPYDVGSKIIESIRPETQIYLEYGDVFPEIEFTGSSGNVIHGLQNRSEFTVITYLSDSCSTCIDVLSDFERFSEVFGNGINYTILWYDNIPLSYLEKYSIDESINYSLNRTRISTSTPTFYILDDNNKIIFRDIKRENLFKKMIELELVPSETLRQNANQYIKNNYFDSDSKRNQLVYFYMPGCSDCEAADALLKSSSLSQELDIVYIYKSDTLDDSKIVDKDKLYANVYGVIWYPSFLVLTETGFKFVGETPMDALLDELKPYS